VSDFAVDERIRRVQESIDKIYSSGNALGEDGQLYSVLPTSVTPSRSRFISKMCLSEGAKTCVETGMAWGLSTLTIVAALIRNGAEPRAHVVMDPWQFSHFHNAGVRVVKDAGEGAMIEFHEQPSELVLPRLLAEGRTFDFAYIDADHEFQAAFVEFFYCDRLLKPGGLLVIDDYDVHGVRLTCEFAELYHGYQLLGEDFEGVRPHKERSWFGLGKPVPSLPWIRAYRKPMESLDRETFKLMPMFMNSPQYRRYASNRLRRQGLSALAGGDQAAARRMLRDAMRAEPDHLKPYLAYLRSFLPRKLADALSSQKNRSPAA